ncbi:MAG: hypothetical protein LBT33_09100, partial [Spirochaetia bacterium]|nr:hypothetical protein [Spirochaetia bacterium]
CLRAQGESCPRYQSKIIFIKVHIFAWGCSKTRKARFAAFYGLVAIFFKAVQAGRGHSPVLVAQNGLPPLQPAANALKFRIGVEL